MTIYPGSRSFAPQRKLWSNSLRLVLGIVVLISLLGFPAVGQAADPPPWPGAPVCEEGTLPATGPVGYQLTLVCLPVVIPWNGILIVYAHGFVPAQYPLALPAGELSQITLPGGVTFVDLLLSMGFGFATSSYSKNGYAVGQAEADLNSLVASIKTAHPELVKVLIVGASEGGLITTELIERDWQIYSGGLALCGPVGGAPYQVKYLGDFRVVFDDFFPGVFDFGVADVPTDAWMNWNEDIINIGAALQSSSEKTSQLFKVTHAALDPADPTGSAFTTATQALFYSIWETPDTIATAGGNPYDNRSTRYRGSADDRLLNFTVERVKADAAAKKFMRRYYQTTGLLQRPLVTMHTTQDPQVPFVHELIYYNLVLNKERLGYLTMIPIIRYGHCNFTPAEALGAFSILLVKTGLTAQALTPYQALLPKAYQAK